MSDQGFVKFVSSVEGRLVPRWGARGYFGAKIITGARGTVIWDTDRVIPLTAEQCRRYSRELSSAFANGDLKTRSYEEWRQSVAVVEAAEQAAASERVSASPETQEQAAPAGAVDAGSEPSGPKRKRPQGGGK